MLNKARLLTRPTPARRDGPFLGQGRNKQREEEVPSALCEAVRPENGSWRMENTLQCFRASGRRENAAGRRFEHPVSWFHTGLRHRLQGMGDSLTGHLHRQHVDED